MSTAGAEGGPVTPAYHIYIELPLRGRLDRDQLLRALKSLEETHAILSATFQWDYPNLYMVPRPGRFSLGEVLFPASEHSRKEMATCLQEFIQQGFDLERGPLWRAQLYHVREDFHVLALVIHHMIIDGESVDILMDDLARAYNGCPTDKGVSGSHTFADFASSQLSSLESDAAAEKLEFWKQELAEVPRTWLTSNSAGVCKEAGRFTAKYSGVTHDGGILRSAWCWLLHDKCQQEDLLTAMTSSHRYEGVQVEEGLVGLYVNMLPVRTRRPCATDRQAFVRSVEKFRLASLQNQLPFEYLLQKLVVRREPVQSHPLFQTLFILLDDPKEDLELQGLESIPRLVARGVTTTFAKYADLHVVPKFELTLRIDVLPDCLHLSFDFAQDVFDEGYVKELAKDYMRIVVELQQARHQSIN